MVKFFCIFYFVFVINQDHFCIANHSNANDSLKVFAAHFEPYVYVKNGEVHDGIEYHLVKMIGEALNKNISFEFGNISNLPNAIDNTNYDIIIGGTFMHLLDSVYHTASVPYEFDDVTWCIQRSKIIPKYINMFRTLTPELWFTMIFFGMFVCGTNVYFLVQFDAGVKRRNQMDFLYLLIIHTMSTFVTVVHNYTPKVTMIRILHGIEIVIPLFFHAFVGLNLYRYAKCDMFYHQISTIREVIENNFRLAGSPEILSMIEHHPMFSSDGRIMFHQCNSLNQCLMDLKRDENYDLAVGGFNRHLKLLPELSASEIFFFDKSESLISYPISLIVKNERKAMIDAVIKRLLESGIVRKIITNLQFMEQQNEIEQDVPLELRFEHIYGVFLFVFGIGMAISTVAWFFELFVNRKLHSNPAHRSWRLIERCVDGQRHYFKNLPEKLQNRSNQEH